MDFGYKPAKIPGSKRNYSVRNGLLCSLLVLIAILIAHPFAEIGFMDDWSYIWSAKMFAHTGHIVYAWSSPILGWQLMLGALFIRLFGFSFTIVRISTLPIAFFTVYLFHAVLLRFGVTPRNAVLGTFTLGLSPLFLPLASSFMTDVPGLFCILLCLYLCQKAVAASSTRIVIFWLCLAALSNLLLGTVRQTSWLGLLIIVPSTAWLLRKRRGVLPAAALLWIISAVGIGLCLRWFAKQPGALHEPLIPLHARDAANPVLYLIIALLGALLFVLFTAYPVLVPWLAQTRGLRRTAWMRAAAASALFLLLAVMLKWTVPWLFYILILEFDTSKTGPLLGGSVTALPWPFWLRLLISFLIFLAAWCALEHFLDRRKQQRPSSTTFIPQWRDIFWLTGPFAISYILLLLPRATFNVISERYLLDLIPIVILYLILFYQQYVAPELPAASVAVLVLFAAFAIAGTHDWFAAYRARLVAINELRVSGVPRTAIQGGFEYDSWTQLEHTGRIDAQTGVSIHFHPGPCRYFFSTFAPSVHPRFTVLFPDRPCVVPAPYPPVSYHAWLPPLHRSIEIEQFPATAAR